MTQFIDIPVTVGLLNSYKLNTTEPLVYNIPVTYLQNLSNGTMIIDSRSNIVLQARDKHVRVNNKMGIGIDPSSAYSLDVSGDTCIRGNLSCGDINGGTIGLHNKAWGNAYIKDISATTISVSGNILPLRDISSDLGSSLKRWRNIFANDLSINTINGQPYSADYGIRIARIERVLFAEGWYGSLSITNIKTNPNSSGTYIEMWLYDDTFLLTSRTVASNNAVQSNTSITIQIPITSRLFTSTSILRLEVTFGGGSGSVVGTPTYSGFTFTGSLSSTAYLTISPSYPSDISITYDVGIPLGWYGTLYITNTRPTGNSGSLTNVWVYDDTTGTLLARRWYNEGNQISWWQGAVAIQIPIEYRLFTPSSTLRLVFTFGDAITGTVVGTPTFSGFTFTGSLSSTAYLTIQSSYPSNIYISHVVRI